MRQHHIAGDKVFVDYSGKKIAIVDQTTGEVHEAEIFLGVLGTCDDDVFPTAGAVYKFGKPALGFSDGIGCLVQVLRHHAAWLQKKSAVTNPAGIRPP
jgi:hypothetical protein